MKDLDDIKSKKDQQASLLNQLPSSSKDDDQEKQSRKREDKELKKLIKEKDKLERDAMVARMLEKDREAQDKNKMSNVVENPQHKGMITDQDRDKYIPELRKISRQKYLEMREEQQLDLFKRRLMDEQRIFGDQPLTEIEKRINELNKRLFELAEKRRQKEQRGPGYHMPYANSDEEGYLLKDKKMAALTKRYEEDKQPPVTE